ncbi:MAG: DNA-binding protein WhiA [Chloroflexi bacterium]|nr:DNA-binding protein WhiA [Chloroflexota bacterium]
MPSGGRTAAARTRTSDAERDLVAALRAELAAVESVRPCCRMALRAGLGAAAEGKARSPVVARLAIRLDTVPSRPFDWSTALDHCRLAWLRGRFLASGSLSVTDQGLHLELPGDAAEAPALVGHLAELGLASAWRMRRGRGVVTLKRTDDLLTLLRLMGASTSVLDLETRLVTRQLQGHLNRVLNAESANLRRTVRAAHRQVGAVEALIEDGRLSELSSVDREVAVARVEAPEASLSELAERVGIGRSRVQRALERIETLQLHG